MSINKSTKRGPFRLLHSDSTVHPYASSQFMDVGDLAACNGWEDVGSSPQMELATDGHQTFVTFQPKDEDALWEVVKGSLLAVRQNPMDLQKWDWWTLQVSGISALQAADKVEFEVSNVEETSAA
jgi:hypothetical protein